MVHNDDNCPAAQKFSHLRSTLSGQALDIIKGLPMTENNYKMAIKKLQQRYDNRSLVIQSHIRAILDCHQVESGMQLQTLHSNVSAHVAALAALEQPIQHWDAWLVTVVLRKLDQSTNQDWQLRRTNTDLSTYAELEGFLTNRCIALESTEGFFVSSERDRDSHSAKDQKMKKSYLSSNSKKVFSYLPKNP